jgi:diacylglycerol kinase family enzyme
MLSRATLFFNPSAGRREAAANRALRDAAEARGVEWVEAGHVIRLRAEVERRVAAGSRLIIAAGGDGTVHHVMQRLVGTPAVLGVIPLGTYNHFARDLGIPIDRFAALEDALGGATRQVDVARAADEYFVNNISLGIYPELVERREERRGHVSRARAMAAAVAATYRAMPSVQLTIDTPDHFERVKTHLFMVSNNAYDLSRAGIRAPRLSFEGGRVSIYWLPNIGRLDFLRMVARFIGGRLEAIGGLRSLGATKLMIGSSHAHVRVGMDGEVFTLATPIAVASMPASLLVKVPR